MWEGKIKKTFHVLLISSKTIKFEGFYITISYFNNTTHPDVFFQDLDDGDLGGELVGETQDDRDEMWMRCWTFTGLVISSWFKLYSEKPNKTLASFIFLKPPWSQKTAGFFDLIYCRWFFLHASTNPLRRIWKEISPIRGEFSINLSIISALKSFSKMQVWQLPSILGKIVGYNIYVAAPRLISSMWR